MRCLLCPQALALHVSARFARSVHTIAGTRRKRKMSTAAIGVRFMNAVRIAARMV